MQEHEHSHILHSKALHILEQALYVLDDIMPSPPTTSMLQTCQGL